MERASKTKINSVTEATALLYRHLSEISQDERQRNSVEESFGVLFNSSLIGIYIVQHGKFRYVNPRMVESIGYSEREILDAESLSFVHPEDRQTVRENAIKMLKGERSAAYEYRITRKNGEARWVLESVMPV